MKILHFIAMLALGFSLCAHAALKPPSNDDLFSSSNTLNGNLGVVFGSNRGATKQLGEPNHAGNASTTSIWYRWTPSVSGMARVETTGSNFDTILAVYTGPDIANLTTIASNDDSVGNTSVVDFAATSGTLYWIAVTGYKGGGASVSATGDVILSYGMAGDPSQFRARRINVGESAGSVTVTVFRTVNVTGSVTVLCSTSGLGQFATPGTDYTSTNTSLVFGNGERSKTFSIPILPDLISEEDEGIPITFNVTAGFGSSLAATEATVTILDDERPVNDNFANAIAISGESGSTPITTQGGSSEAGEPVDYKFETPHTVWYRWTAPRTAAVAWYTQSDAFTSTRLYTGAAVGALTLTPQAGGQIGAFRVVQGTEYWVQADAYTGTSTVANGTLQWFMYEPGTFQFREAAVAGFKSAGVVSLTIARTVGADTDETLFVQSSDGTATSPADFTSVFQPVVFAAGEVERTVDITLTRYGFALNGATFTVTIAGIASSGSIGANAVATITLWDNDVFINAYPLVGASGQILATTTDALVEPSEPRHGDAQGDQTKTVWFDWVAPSTGPFVFSNAVSSSYNQLVQMSVYTGSAVDALTRVADGEPHSAGVASRNHLAFFATSGTTYHIGVREFLVGSGTRFSLQWEPASTFTFSQPTYLTTEPTGPLSIVINRAGPVAVGASIKLTAQPGTAGPNDFQEVSTSFDFGPGESTKTIIIPITNDTLHEIAETFSLTLSSPTGNGYAAPLTTSTVTITSEDLFVARPGTYCAIVSLGSSPSQNGAVKAIVTSTGKLTGTLTFAGKKTAFSATLNAAGNATITIPRKAPASALVLTLASTTNGARFVATLADGNSTVLVDLDKLPFDPKANIAPTFGRYTAYIGDLANIGDGITLVSVALNGTVTLVGQLADGTPFSGSGSQAIPPESGVSEVHSPLHIPLYKGAGYLRGDLQFKSVDDYPLAATLRWVKPALPKEKYYPVALDLAPTMRGSRYTAPTAGNRIIPMGALGGFNLEVGGAGIPQVSDAAYLLVNNLVNTYLFTNPTVSLGITAKTGLVATTVTVPAVKPVPLKGKAAILQGSREMRGHFLNPVLKTSGAVRAEF
jgi:hypothetical protein